MKAWIVSYDGWVFPYHADTRGQVRSMFAGDHIDGDFYESLNVSVRRAPKFDDREFDHFEMLELGYYTWAECDKCGGMVSCIDSDYKMAFQTSKKFTLCDYCYLTEGDEWEPTNY